MALEELPATIYGVSSDGGIKVNLLGPSQATLTLTGVGTVRVEQNTQYPFDGDIEIRVVPERRAKFTVQVRVPQWATGADIRVNGATVASQSTPGDYVPIEREWRGDDVIALRLPMQPLVHRKSNRNVQESRAPDDSPVSQEVLHFDYLAVTRGPLVYASGLIDGYKIDETLRLDAQPAETWIETVAQEREAADAGPDIRLRPLDRAALTLVPYYRAGGRRDGTWRLTWLSLAPEVSP
jgi:DUF1680 family protein